MDRIKFNAICDRVYGEFQDDFISENIAHFGNTKKSLYENPSMYQSFIYKSWSWGTMIQGDVVIHARNVMQTKQKEYATDSDVLHNFRVGSMLSGQSMQDVCKGFMLKHFISILDMTGKESCRYAFEKFGDYLNYLCLLEACRVEEEGDEA